MQFNSDNAAAVHPAVWDAMRAADAPAMPYDGDGLSLALDEVFSGVFGRECAALWVASGTAANCLALAAMVEPHRGVLCHAAAHIENDECGAPAFFTHGAKTMPVGGADGKVTVGAMRELLAPVRRDVHRVWPQAISITQANEAGCVYRPGEVAAIGDYAREQGFALHMDGARFANAVAFLGCSPAEASVAGGVDALSFGCVKNGGMSAEALVFFEPGMADVVRYRRKRAGHLQSKGRFLAAQILALVEGGLWLENARAANAAAAEIGAAAGGRLLHPVEANEVFLTVSAGERAALRGQGFGFYDWGAEGARFVTAWNCDAGDVGALARAGPRGVRPRGPARGGRGGRWRGRWLGCE
jgi:threonine aldolase